MQGEKEGRRNGGRYIGRDGRGEGGKEGECAL